MYEIVKAYFRTCLVVVYESPPFRTRLTTSDMGDILPSAIMPQQSGYRRVYHFLKPEYAIRDIQRKRLKLATFPNLNDPFELLAARISPPELDEFLFDTWRRDYGLLCFCSGWSNPLMWAHYAEGHRGIVFGLDVSRKILFDVRYVEEPETISVPEYLTERLLEELEQRGKVSSKLDRDISSYLGEKVARNHHGWSYEAEVRALLPLKHQENGLFFKSFSRQIQLREVILGTRCALEEPYVQSLVPGYVSVFRAKLNTEAFTLHRDDDHCDKG